ncbi:TPA: hypothetical protein N0F65_000479 [Lagenidium giganteum]|uniref:RNA 3'-terminal phosphate cyclase domain-containing protein n=1 Tax=Lagenidium giganteum TaxID=4803 RepID=A0AAV2Z163_9STRA|nr:TPA: hypothetical protein N0F65_000479 [Lagenidium giganteum]
MASSPLIDIGANLTNRRFQKDLPAVLRRAAQAGLEAIVVTGTSITASRDAVRVIAQQQSRSTVTLVSTVGVHPHDAKDFDFAHTVQHMHEIIQAHPGVVVAVGECGLDFNRDFSPRDVQERAFRAQVELACELQLPLFLHEREAHSVFCAVLEPFLQAGRLPPVVVHCFTGTESELRKYISMGFYIGLTGFVCMDSRGFKLRTMASQIPQDKLMIETDAPFMYPYSGGGGRGGHSRCEPKDLRAVVQTLASCYRLSEDEISAMTTRNAKRFFNLDAQAAARSQANPEANGTKLGAQPHENTNAKKKDGNAGKSGSHGKPPQIKTSVVAAVDPSSLADCVSVDGADGEGGGQVLRMSMALATVLRKNMHVHSIRAKRSVPGLRNQHVCSIQLVGNIGGGELTGGHLSSTAISYAANGKTLTGGSFIGDAKTAGSVSLMIQAALPALLFSAKSSTVTLRGGTDVDFSPPIEFMRGPFRQLLAGFGAAFDIAVKKRGFFPEGGGEVELQAQHIQQPLKALDWTTSSKELRSITSQIIVRGVSVDDQLGQEYVNALRKALGSQLQQDEAHGSPALEFEVTIVPKKASTQRKHFGKGKKPAQRKDDQPEVSVLCVAETGSGCLVTVDRAGKLAADEAAELLAGKLFSLLRKGVCTDEHLADNAVVFMALAQGTSKLRVPSKSDRTSHHLETALGIAARFTGAKFRLVEESSSAVVEVDGIGYDAS